MGRRLKDKVAVVTGAGKGIGKGIARVFALEGAKVVVANRSEESGQETVSEIKKNGGEGLFVQTDISRPEDTERMAQTTVDAYGRIDILCQNAGIYTDIRLEDMSLEEWDRVCNVNLRGSFLVIRACLPQMIKQHYGRIVMTSSITGPKTGIPGQSHYAASKAGMNGLIHSAALEFARHNITINGVEPGNILTEGLVELGEEHIQGMAESIPLGRMGTPEDIAYAMLFLASDEASWITGATLVVDGGQILPESKYAIN